MSCVTVFYLPCIFITFADIIRFCTIMARTKKKTASKVDPEYLKKQREQLLRKHQHKVLFNALELAAIDEYCSRFKVKSRSALIRQATMERVMEGLEESHPTLF